MRADTLDLTTSAFAALPTAAGGSGGVIATERLGLGIARIAARRAQTAKVAELLRGQLGVEPPSSPRCASRGGVGIASIAPATWLATCEDAGNSFAESLRARLGESAAVVDQTDAYAILRLNGPKVRETLAKLIPIDLHPRAFQVNDVRQTLCGYVSVTVWRLEDGAPGAAVFEIWADRSLAVSLHQAISHAAAEFGFAWEPFGAGMGRLTA